MAAPPPISPASSKGESKSIDFKSTFNPKQTWDSCELLEDFVAMANSGGAGALRTLLSGKYKGDVPRMLERIETYRRETEEDIWSHGNA